MPNAENLIPNSQRTPSELAKMRRNGGIKSGETRRKKANLRKTFEMLAQMKIAPDDMRERLQEMGLDPTGENAIAMAMMLQAMAGDVKAFEQCAKYLGQDKKNEAQVKESEERAKLVKAQREALETKDEPEQYEDDGFLEALKGTASADWASYKDEVESEAEEQG